MRQFKLGDYAFLEGQIVEIKRFLGLFNKERIYKVCLMNCRLEHRVKESSLTLCENQLTPKILFKNKV